MLGVCQYTETASGSACDDDVDETINDSCSAGTCAGTNPCDGVVCNPSSSCVTSVCQNSVTNALADRGTCLETPVADGSACEDALGDATVDTCQAGTCVSVAVPPIITTELTDQTIEYGTHVLLQPEQTFGTSLSWAVNDVALPAFDNNMHYEVAYATESFDATFTASNDGDSGVQTVSTSATITVLPPAASDTPPDGFAYLIAPLELDGLDETVTTSEITNCIVDIVASEVDTTQTVTFDTVRADDTVGLTGETVGTKVRGMVPSSDEDAKIDKLNNLVSADAVPTFGSRLSDCVSAARGGRMIRREIGYRGRARTRRFSFNVVAESATAVNRPDLCGDFDASVDCPVDERKECHEEPTCTTVKKRRQ